MARNDSILVLSESFDRGWKAYDTGDSGQETGVKKTLASIFPFIFGKEVKSHVLVNNWANGWILDNKQQTSNNKLTLVYLPQYLEILGLLFLGIPLLFILISLYERFILPITTNVDAFFDLKANALRKKINKSLHPNS